MKVQVWSDIMCPFCYLGDKNLKNAISEYAGNELIEIEFKAFQLNPSQPKVLNPDNPINYTIKKGIPEVKVKTSFEYLENEAKKLGLPMDVKNAKVVNSLNALRLVKYAQINGKYEQIKDELFRAYFANGKDLSETETLVAIAKNAGFDVEKIKEFLNSKQLINEVLNDRNEGISKGLQGVPFFVINNQYVLSGNQSKDNFLNVFKKINPSDSNSGICDINLGICN